VRSGATPHSTSARMTLPASPKTSVMLNADREMRRAYADLAYSRARERFTTKRMIDEYLHLYRSLVPARSVAA
jgi:hypothetical protein